MTEASLDLQKAIRARLVVTSAVTSLVPASSILDRNARPEVFPCILIGEGQTLMDAGIARDRSQVFTDLHVWQTEAGLAGCKGIVGAIRDALSDGYWTLDHHQVADLYLSSVRFMRDPDGIHSHGVVTVRAALVELA